MTDPFGKYPCILIIVLVLFFAGTATAAAVADMQATINRPGDPAGKSVALVEKYQYVQPLLKQYPSYRSGRRRHLCCQPESDAAS